MDLAQLLVVAQPMRNDSAFLASLGVTSIGSQSVPGHG